MISDNVIQAYPLSVMVQNANILTFVTEQAKDGFFMSLITPSSTVRILQFPTLAMTTSYTAKFLEVTTGLLVNYITDMEDQISVIIASS